jgi:hypothetical protein
VVVVVENIPVICCKKLEVLLKVALNTINQSIKKTNLIKHGKSYSDTFNIYLLGYCIETSRDKTWMFDIHNAGDLSYVFSLKIK